MLEPLEDRRLLAVVWDRIEPLGSLIFEAEVAGGTGAPVSIFADDEEEDKLTGSSDQDLFYDGLGDILTDVKTKKDVETVL